MTSPLRLIIVVGALAAGLGLAMFERATGPRPALPILGQLPGFRLVDESGAPFGRESMVGHVNVVDFIFTRCSSSCPRLTARMGELQEILARQKSSARLVSFSVDPENDTPPVLSEYAAQAHADLSRWSFVTGPLEQIQRAALDGFKVSVEKITREAGDYDVVHGEWFVLVDAGGRLRGYYSVRETSDLDALAKDVQVLEARP
jgi:protein SCO1/2